MRYRDTRGDDTLIGTDDHDYFRIRKGHDVVDRGDGYDRLSVDDVHVRNTVPAYGSIAVLASGAIGGDLKAGNGSTLSFSSIEQVTYVGTDEGEAIVVSIGGHLRDGALVLDGGGGENGLSLDLKGIDKAANFVVGDDGVARVAGASFASFSLISAYFGASDHVVVGGAEVDQFQDSGGDDILSGGGGDDLLLGDLGVDRLSGGSGADAFVWTNAEEARPATPDLITDFSHAEGDSINLTQIDADTAAPRNQAFVFIDQAAFTGPGGQNGEVRQQVDGDGTVTLQGDVNHDGGADFAILVTTPVTFVVDDLRL